MIHIDQVIQQCLTAIYSNDVLNEKLYLKGGQALRLAHNLKSRFSRDADFSTPSNIEDVDSFFNNLKQCLENEFLISDYSLFDFKYIRKPAQRDNNTPDFWGGWAVEFKLIEKEKALLPITQRRRESIIPEGSESSKILLDISEYEYCGSIEYIKIGSVEIKSYSRVLLVLEKIRAICQQHPDYPHRRTTADRSRDYYDIERLYQKILNDNKEDEFIEEAGKHISDVFKAKGVDVQLLDRIFDPSFYSLQAKGWEATKRTVSQKVDEFSYYNETLKNIVKMLEETIRNIRGERL